jgi:Mn2+/Fe2+ NRAMP family transporter
MIVAMILGIILNFVGLDPIKALIYSAVLNGIISPVILFLIVYLGSNEQVMGKFKNKTTAKIFGWFTVLLLTIVSISTIIFLFL